MDEKLMYLVDNYKWNSFNGFKRFVKQWNTFDDERKNEVLLWMTEGVNWQKAISYTKDPSMYRIISKDKAEAAKIKLSRESEEYGENKTLGFIWHFIPYEIWEDMGEELLVEHVFEEKELPCVGTIYYEE